MEDTPGKTEIIKNDCLNRRSNHFSPSPEVRLENLLELRNPHQPQRLPMQVVDVILAVVQLGCDLLPAQESEVAHLKQRLTLHVVDTPDRFPDRLLQYHQIRDAGGDLIFQLGDAHHRLLNR